MDAGCCAAHAAFSTARLLGCDPIALVGQDAALTGGEFYAPSTHFGGMRLAGIKAGRGAVVGDEAKERLHRGTVVEWTANQSVPIHEVPAWGGQGSVWSTASLDYVREWYEEAAQDGGGRIVNATEGGARIAGVPEARLADLLADLHGDRGTARVDFGRIARAAAAPSADDRLRVAEAVGQARRQALAAAAAARRTAATDLGPRAVDRLKAKTRLMLLQGYARRDVLDVVERKGDLRELCAVLGRRADALADRLAACESAVRATLATTRRAA
jgi:hypothetical protein